MNTTQWRISISIHKIAQEQVEQLLALLLPDSRGVFTGLCTFMVRYDEKERAYARAYDVETTFPCGRVLVEEVLA